MNFAGIFREIMVRRMLTESSSLPVIAQKDDRLEVIWFTYRFEKKEQGNAARIRAIYSTGDGNHIEEEAVEMEEPVTYGEAETPVLETKAYYARLEKLYDDFDSELMEELLKKAVSEAFLPVYKAAVQHHLNMELTEPEAQTDTIENGRHS